jgi:hypothetical protein
MVAERFQRRHQRFRQVLIQRELHPVTGTGGIGKSSAAKAAAKVITALNGSGLTVGKSARITSAVAPSARLPAGCTPTLVCL